MQALELPYRVLNICTGDLGDAKVKGYDIECWIPSEGRYRETHSDSYFHDYQARRADIRYRDSEGTVRFVHTLNNTALASTRTIIALVENHQQADGTVAHPRGAASLPRRTGDAGQALAVGRTSPLAPSPERRGGARHAT